MGTEIKPAEVKRSFEPDWYGPDGIVAALTAVAEGKAPLATFVVTRHPMDGPPGPETQRVSIGRAKVERVLSWRYCGGDSGEDPDGHGSHALCASYHEQSIAHAAAWLSVDLEWRRLDVQRHGDGFQYAPCVFRQ